MNVPNDDHMFKRMCEEYTEKENENGRNVNIILCCVHLQGFEMERSPLPKIMTIWKQMDTP